MNFFRSGHSTNLLKIKEFVMNLTKILFNLATILTIFIAGCAGLSENSSLDLPTAITLSENSAGPILDNDPAYKKIAFQYHLAKKKFAEENFNESCTLIKEINLSYKGPIEALFLIQEVNFCPTERESLISFFKTFSPPSWLSNFYYQSMLEKAEKFKLSEYIAEFKYQLAKVTVAKPEKVRLTLEAIEELKKSKNQESKKEYQKYLYSVAPRYNQKITEDNIYAVAVDYEGIREFEKARKLYRSIIGKDKYPIELKVQAYGRLNMSIKKERKKREYVDGVEAKAYWLKSLIKNNQHTKIDLTKQLFKTYIKLARAQWTLGETDKAIKGLNHILKSTDQNEFIAQANWLLGLIYIEKKEVPRASEYFTTAFKVIDLSEDFAEKLTWYNFWSRYKQGNFKEANEFLTQYINHNKDKFSSKFTFWLAKSLQKLNDKEQANQLFNKIIDEEAFNYYSILSHYEIDKKISPLSKHNPRPSKEIELFNWLIALNEPDLLKAQLKSLSEDKNFKNQTALIPYYYYSKDYMGGIINFYSLEEEKRKDIALDNILTIFPTPYETIIKKHASKNEVNPYLLWSIARQESAFNSRARSWADAFGVLQITPELARYLKKKYKVSFNNYLDLYDPDKNIEFASIYFKELRKKHKYNFIKYVASYNASEKAVNRWFKQRYEGDPIEFIETIPYDETQKYIKLVFRNFITYRRLFADEKFGIHPNFFMDDRVAIE